MDERRKAQPRVRDSANQRRGSFHVSSTGADTRLRSSGAPVVCLVSGDARSLVALERLLPPAGLALEAFPTASAFFNGSLADEPACLVVDLHLPDGGGLALQERLAQTGVPMPIVFLSDHPDVPAAVRAMRGGAADVLVKPPDDTILMTAIAAAIDGGRRRRLEEDERRQARARFESLTRREREVAARVADGSINKQIAAAMGVSEQTVKIHRARVMRKLGVGSVPALVRLLARCE